MRVHRHWSKVLFVAVALAAAGAGGFLAVRTTGVTFAGGERVRNVPSPSGPGTKDDEKALRQIQSAFVKAFNAGDAKALAAFWAPDGEFVDAEGRSFRGRGAIEKEFAAFFAESKGVTLQVTTDSLRFVSPGVALESGSSRVVRPSDGAASSTTYSIVHTRRDGRWQLAAVRELPYALASNYEHLRDLEWLVGNWTAKGGGQTLELACEWTAKQNFLTRRYSRKGADGATTTGIQIICWDPVGGEIRSWVFDGEGGFGSERWTRDGPRWVLEATGVTRDGAQTTSTNVVTRLDQDHFTWQSVRRTLNQVRLPDTAAITVTRAKAKK
jgi:uncharacterized protein (TIGR02246 family)